MLFARHASRQEPRITTPSCSRIATLLAALVACTAVAPAAHFGRRFPSEKRILKDKVTGVEVVALTTDPANDSKIYQTHAQWTADGQWIVFRSNRGAPTPAPAPAPTPDAAAPAGRGGRTGGGGSPGAAFAVHEQSGAIVQLTEYGGYSGMLNLARRSMKLYFQRSANRASPVQVIEFDLERLFADSAAGKLKDASAYERVCGSLPAGRRESGGFGLDAEETFAYLGVREGDTGKHLPSGTGLVQTLESQRMGAGPAGLRSMNIPGASSGAFEQTNTHSPCRLLVFVGACLQAIQDARRRHVFRIACKQAPTSQPSRSKPWSPPAPPKADKLRGIGPKANGNDSGGNFHLGSPEFATTHAQ